MKGYSVEESDGQIVICGEDGKIKIRFAYQINDSEKTEFYAVLDDVDKFTVWNDLDNFRKD